MSALLVQCCDCRHSFTDTLPDRSLARFCRRYPPTAQMVPNLQRGQVVGMQIMTIFPSVRDEQGCGEFSARDQH